MVNVVRTLLVCGLVLNSVVAVRATEDGVTAVRSGGLFLHWSETGRVAGINVGGCDVTGRGVSHGGFALRDCAVDDTYSHGDHDRYLRLSMKISGSPDSSGEYLLVRIDGNSEQPASIEIVRSLGHVLSLYLQLRQIAPSVSHMIPQSTSTVLNLTPPRSRTASFRLWSGYSSDLSAGLWRRSPRNMTMTPVAADTRNH